MSAPSIIHVLSILAPRYRRGLEKAPAKRNTAKRFSSMAGAGVLLVLPLLVMTGEEIRGRRSSAVLPADDVKPAAGGLKSAAG